jgi:hypothetical protein
MPSGILLVSTTRAALVGLDLVQSGLLLPPLGVERGQLGGRVPLVVEQVGDQPVLARAAPPGSSNA